ncbi:MAG TPA: hypothetical protein VNQ90_09965 [Chthoniobacteraceae bacterium]|nr:hypothetical protein [Chthoniobacteraceae bacterium]
MNRWCRHALAAAGLFTVLAGSALAEEVALRNEKVELRFPGEGEVLLRNLIHRPRELDQLRTVDAEGSFLPFGEEAQAEEGFRVAIAPEGEEGERYLRWKVVAEKEGEVVLADEEGRVEARFTLMPQSAAVDVAFTFAKELPRPATARLVWMLQVAGDFLGVPTEGPADYQIVPVADDGATQIHTIAVHRETAARYALAQPWWGVADRASDFLLACQFETGPVVLEQWSGLLQTTEAFRQTAVIPLPASGGKEVVRLRLFLFNRLTGLSGLSRNAGCWIMEDDRAPEKKTLVIAPALPLPRGTLRLLAGEKECLRVDVNGWEPGKIYAHELPSSLPKGKQPLKVELKTPDFEETIPLWTNLPPKL